MSFLVCTTSRKFIFHAYSAQIAYGGCRPLCLSCLLRISRNKERLTYTMKVQNKQVTNTKHKHTDGIDKGKQNEERGMTK